MFLRKIFKNTKPANIKLKNYKNVFRLNSTYLIDEDTVPEMSKNNVNKYSTRSNTCGELNSKDIGKRVKICGWLEFQRMNKFIVLRDGYGKIQCLLDENDKSSKDLIENMPYESILEIEGTVLSRPKNMINYKLSTGEIEVLINKINILNKANYLPFNIREFQRAKESLRMQYRYLDLRFAEMQKHLRVRSKFFMKLREFLIQNDFVDVETPTLFKKTPGGAREFIVPTKFSGQFYSLVQSPQQFKQMLMAGAIDRYFQIARCYRDETSRPDRQPEFTQLDIEISFTDMEFIIQLVEDLLNYSWLDFAGNIPRSFKRISYKDAINFYGTDKPDTSFDFKIEDCTEFFNGLETNSNGDFKAAYLKFSPPFINLTKNIRNEFDKLSKQYTGTKLFQNKISSLEDWISKNENIFSGKSAKYFIEKTNLLDNDVMFIAIGNPKQVLELLGKIRLEYANHLEKSNISIRRNGMHFLWVTDFPLFEIGLDSNSLCSTHHPFTAPNSNDLDFLDTEPLKVRSLAYDLVLNGNEIGGGSIRIHDPVLQQKIFDKLNITQNTMKHFIEMLSSGCPPHGGIALGLDRLLSVILKTASIRDVIAFPKGFEGRDPLSGAPSSVSEEDLKFYHIKCTD